MSKDDNGIKRPVMHSPDGVSLRDYIDMRIGALQAIVEKSEGALSIRLAGMNEIRESMRDQSSRFVTRAEADLVHKSMCDHIDALREESAENRGKASQKSVLVAYALSLVSLVIGLVRLFKGL